MEKLIDKDLNEIQNGNSVESSIKKEFSQKYQQTNETAEAHKRIHDSKRNL